MRHALPVDWKRDPRGLLLLLTLAAATALAAAPGRRTGPREMPGPLSAAHVPKPGEIECSACHSAPGKVAPAKCLACHTEIASRVAAGKGFHRDKGDDCAVCHTEHQGRQADIVPLEKDSFDHSETGADLQGAHLRTKNCDKCHTPSNTLPRTRGRSYLFKDPGCRGCHTPPHPGKQDRCVGCHSQDSWVVERLDTGD